MEASPSSPAVITVGLACVDFVNIVEQYPAEDTLARATEQTVSIPATDMTNQQLCWYR